MAAWWAARVEWVQIVHAAGLHRQCLFGGLRIGLYEPVKKVYMGDRPPTDAPLYLKVAAGLTTGAVAIAIASPTDLVKVSAPERSSGVLAACHHMPVDRQELPSPVIWFAAS